MEMCLFTFIYVIVIVVAITAIGYGLGKLNKFGDSDEIIREEANK